MKKIIITIVFLLFSYSALSQVNVSLPAGSSGPGGTEIEIPINVSDLTNKDIISYQFKITFNNTVLSALDVSTTGTLSAVNGWTVLPNITTPGEITVGAFGSSALSGNGSLIKIKFRVVGSGGYNTALSFSSFIFNSGNPSSITTNGSFSVTSAQQPVLNVNPVNREVSSTQGTTTFDVSNTGSGNMTWTTNVTDGASWLNVTNGGSGTNSGTITLNYAANLNLSSRTGKVLVIAAGASGSPKEVTVIQAGNTSTNQVGISLPINSSGGLGTEVEIPITASDLAGKDIISYQFKVSFNNNVLNALDIITIGTLSTATGWTVLPNISNPGEITVGAFGSGSLSGGGTLLKLKFKVAGAPGTSTNLTFSSFIFNSGSPLVITGNGNFTVNPGSQPVLKITPENKDISASGGLVEFNVQNAGTGILNWISNISSGSDWINIISGNSGTNNGIITVNCLPNGTTQQRTGKIQISASGSIGSPKDLLLYQAGATIKKPVIFRSPEVLVFGSTSIVSAADSSFIIKNIGDTILIINEILTDGANSNEFMVLYNNIPKNILPNEEIIISIRFIPKATGIRYGRIVIKSNDSQNMEVAIVVRGEGIIVLPEPPKINIQSNVTINPTNGSISWGSSGGATSYHLQISKDSNFLILIKNSIITDTILKITDLEDGMIYYLRICAANSIGNSNWSNTIKILTSITSLSNPTLSSPLNNSSSQPTTITLKWNLIKNAASYSLQLAKDIGFTNVQREYSGITDTIKSITGLENNMNYFWRVNSRNTTIESEWSQIWKFTTLNRAPAVFSLLSPKNNFTLELTYPAKNVTFNWNKSNDPDVNDIVKYTFILVIGEFLFTKSNLVDTSITLDIMQYLKPSSTYKWTVSATDGKEIISSILPFSFYTSGSFTNIESKSSNAFTYKLHQNYPNPFNPSTNISFDLPVSDYVRLTVFDILGKEIAVLINKPLSPGTHSVDFNAANLQTGIYYYKLQSGKYVSVRKMLYVR